jgi:hypothetical protein
MPRKPVGLRFNALDLARWQTQARMERRSLTGLIERAVAEYVQRAEILQARPPARRKNAK